MKTSSFGMRIKLDFWINLLLELNIGLTIIIYNHLFNKLPTLARDNINQKYYNMQMSNETIVIKPPTDYFLIEMGEYNCIKQDMFCRNLLK